MKQESEQFKVEATPVIDLKQSPMAGMWENEKTEVYLEDESGGAAFLLTPEGDYVPISAFPFVIGRGNECDLVLNKKGISRKHAEIVFQSGRFVVNDLESLNGLKVNGYKVARVILEEGDSIKLGEVNLVFTATRGGHENKTATQITPDSAVTPQQSVVQPSGVSRNRLLYGVAGVSTLVIVVAIGMMLKGTPVANDVNQRIVSAPNAASMAQRPSRSNPSPNGGAAMVEPTVAESRATSPSVNIDAGAEPPPPVTSASQDSAKTVTELPPDPTAPPPSIALSSPSSFAMPPPPPAEQRMPPPVVRKPPTVQGEANRQEAKPIVVARPLQAPPQVRQTEPAARPVASAAVASPAQAYGSQHDVDGRYLSGDVDALLREMEQAVKTSKAGDAAYRAKYNTIASLYGKYNAGKQAYLEGRQVEAFEQWSAFLNEEKAQFGVRRSPIATATLSKLVDGYAALGNEAAKSGKNHDAYRYWQKSVGYGDSIAARIALEAANQKSQQLYRQALRLEYVNTERAKELWRQVMEIVPPGTEYYTKSSSKLAWYDQWGA